MFRTLTLSFVLKAAEAASGEFNYDDIGANWKEHTPLCGTGREQSPIDLVHDADFVKKVSSGLKFEGYDYKNYASGAVLDRKAHTVQMGVDAGTLIEELPDGDGSTFTALQLHFHAPSEHTVNGKYMDLEMHVVHLHESGERFSVLGFMFDVEAGGDSENEFLAAINVEGAPVLTTDPGTPLVNANLADFLGSVDMQKFWHYNGSFTTPPCTEGVEWLVMEQVQPISSAQLAAFHAQTWGNMNWEAGEGNNRETMPMYERTLWYTDSSQAAALALGAAALSLLALF